LRKSDGSLWYTILGGMFGLVVAMGIGRFAFTPMIPPMQRAFGIGDDTAGFLASINYLGYLLGAVACQYGTLARKRTLAFRLSMVLSVLTTGAMGLTTSVPAWSCLRLLAGIASAGIFVSGSSIVLETLVRRDQAHLSGYIYSGVGIGIGISGLAVPILDSAVGVQDTWVVLAVLGLPLALVSWRGVVDCGSVLGVPASRFTSIRSSRRSILPWLTAAYFCEGLGYIVSGTFLVSIVQQSTSSLSSGNGAWVLVGLTAAVSTVIWSYVSKRTSYIGALISAHLVQALGIALPAVSQSTGIAYLGAFLFGGTFVGIAVLSLGLGKLHEPYKNSRIVGTLTIVYGIGQIIGPWLAGVVAARMSSFALPLACASLIVAFGALLLAVGWWHCSRASASSSPCRLS
jgi:predicted MFS family arabinose efflux permease